MNNTSSSNKSIYTKKESAFIAAMILVCLTFGVAFFNLEWFFSSIERNTTTIILSGIFISSPIYLTIVYDKIGSSKNAVTVWFIAFMTTAVAYINILSYKYGACAMTLELVAMVLAGIFMLPVIEAGFSKLLIVFEWATGLYLVIKYNDNPYWSLAPDQLYSGKYLITLIPVYISIIYACIMHIKEIVDSKKQI